MDAYIHAYEAFHAQQAYSTGRHPCVVLRSYTVAELDTLADRAGFEDRWVVKEPF